MKFEQTKVRVPNIPHEGLHFDFELDPLSLKERLEGQVIDSADSSNPTSYLSNPVAGPGYTFKEPLKVSLDVSSEGRTVEMNGTVTGSYLTSCSRCAGEATDIINVPFNLFVKPRQNKDDEEDLNYGFYEGDELNCSNLVEDIVVLKISFSIHCGPDCHGLCPKCGINLNLKVCDCKVEDVSSELDTVKPFEKLKGLKLIN